MEIFSPPFCFESPNAIARPVMPRDATSLFEDLFSDPAVMRNIEAKLHTSINETKVFIQGVEQSWNTNFIHMWAVEHKTSGRILGLVNLQGKLPRVEIGAMSVQKSNLRNRRAFFDLFLRILDWTIAQPSVHYLYACSDPGSSSEQVIEHFGFKLEAQLPNWESRPNQGLASVPINLYGIARPFKDFVHFLHYSWFKRPEQASMLLSRSLLLPLPEEQKQSAFENVGNAMGPRSTIQGRLI